MLPLFINKDFIYTDGVGETAVKYLDVIIYPDYSYPVCRVILTNGVVYDNVPFEQLSLYKEFTPKPQDPTLYKFSVVFNPHVSNYNVPFFCNTYDELGNITDSGLIFVGNIDCYPYDINFNIVCQIGEGCRLLPNKRIRLSKDLIAKGERPEYDQQPTNIKKNTFYVQ